MGKYNEMKCHGGLIFKSRLLRKVMYPIIGLVAIALVICILCANDLTKETAYADNNLITASNDNEMCIKKISGYSDDVVFLPAFDGATYLADNGILFYEDELGTKPLNVVNNLVLNERGCTMQDFYCAIKYSINHGDSIYAKAPLGTKFYATTSTSFKDAFEVGSGPEIRKPVYNFSEQFKTNLKNLGLPTSSVYTFKPGDTDYGYWDAPCSLNSPEPQLNGIGYLKFYSAYTDLLKNGSHVWASREQGDGIIDFFNAFCFSSNEGWIRYNKSEQTIASTSVVVTLNFDTPNTTCSSEDSKPLYNNQQPTGNIQKVGWYSNGTVFLPAFTCPTHLVEKNVVFYEDAQGTRPYEFFNDIIHRNGGCTMSQIKIAYDLAKKRGDTLYAKANAGYKFYGTAITRWNDAFSTECGTYYDFMDEFKNILRDQGLPTTSVYTSKPGDADFGGWNADYDSIEDGGDIPPTINSIKYSDFLKNYSAYACDEVWTSKSSGLATKFHYNYLFQDWMFINTAPTDHNGVVLTLVF